MRRPAEPQSALSPPPRARGSSSLALASDAADASSLDDASSEEKYAGRARRARRDAADADADVRGVDGPGPPRRAPEARRGVGRDDEPRSRARSSPREAEPRGIARDGASAASDPREAERADACGGRRAEERNATTPQPSSSDDGCSTRSMDASLETGGDLSLIHI